MLCNLITCYSTARAKLQCLTVKRDEVLSNQASNFKLRRYTSGSAATGSAKYRGVAVVGARLYLAPHNQDNVGVLGRAVQVEPMKPC